MKFVTEYRVQNHGCLWEGADRNEAHREMWDARIVLHLDLGDGYTNVYNRQNSIALKPYVFHYQFLYLSKEKERILDKYYSKRPNWGGGD